MGITEPGADQISGIAVVPPGLEDAAAAELTALGCQAVTPLRRAVRFQSDLAGYYRLHLQARLPFRLLRELAQFPCRGRDDLYDGVQRAADWTRWLPPGATFRVDATGTAPGLNHSHYSALQVKNALVDLQRQQWGARSSVDLDDPDLALHLHLGGAGSREGSTATLSLDGSGGSLLLKADACGFLRSSPVVARASIGANQDLGPKVPGMLAAEEFKGARSHEFKIVEVSVNAEDSHAKEKISARW